jgi:demethylmenaquinone methyltransferase/2-methoxy-6-polyprenyl-1,4-benzoquinol methylase
MGSRHDYAVQAGGYDETRHASPSIVRPLAAALAGARGLRLLDVGGGTGNYAAALEASGYRATVVDVAPAMLAHARAKGLSTVRGDATALPIGTASVHAVALVSMLHLVSDWRRAIDEARRVLAPGGRLAIMIYALEHLEVHWILRYFPSSESWVRPEHQSLDEMLALLPGARWTPFEFADLDDASMAALCRRPHLLLDRAYRARTSFFERLEASDPDGLERGLARLARDLAAGRRPDDEVAAVRVRYGDGAVIAWVKPAPLTPSG